MKYQLRYMISFVSTHMLLILASGVTISLFATISHWADLASHFTLHYAAGATILLPLFLWLKRGWQSFACLLLIVICGLKIHGTLKEGDAPSSDRPYETVTLMQFNMHVNNPDVPSVVRFIQSQPTLPQVVVLQEVMTAALPALAVLTNDYPYQFIFPENGAFGAAIFSRLPFIHQERATFPGGMNHFSRLTMETPYKNIPFELMEAHAVPPMQREFYQQRNDELAHLARLAASAKDTPLVLMGDFNITPYSPWFSTLEEDSGLRNGMRGSLPYGTWPRFLPMALRIPIDHLLISGKISLVRRKVGPDLGSDHLPVLTTLKIFATE